MYKAYLEEEHPGLYERLILNGTLHTLLADANERAEAMIEILTEKMKKQECITELLKAEQPMAWVGRMNSIRYRGKKLSERKPSIPCKTNDRRHDQNRACGFLIQKIIRLLCSMLRSVGTFSQFWIICHS